MSNYKDEIRDLIVYKLEDYEGYGCDFINECFNQDYFIVGRQKAKEWLEENYGVFEAIETIRDYELDNFGELSTDISDPEKVCNMLAYILGDNGKAIGPLQIHPIMVKEVNRLIGFEKYSNEDRLSELKSVEMAKIFLGRRVENIEALTALEVEDCVKSWNGGGSWRKGNKKKQSNLNRYYKKFIEILSEQ